jgi:membrane protease YdiL (CAAX protease family)
MDAKLFKPKRFFIIIYLITYISWFFSAYISRQPGGENLFIIFMLPGLFAPFLVALYMIRSSGSKELWQTFKDRLFNLRLINPVVFLPSLLITPAAILIAAVISIVLGGDTSQLQFSEGFSFTIGMVPTLVILILAATFEELGWRSYAMDSLHSRYEYFTATLIFGLLWSGWHIPMFFIQGSYQNEIALENLWFAVNFLVSILPLAFIISWICKSNRGSITAAVILHFFINLSQEALQITQETKCIETGILVIFAVIIVLLNKSLFFDKHKELVTK